MQGISFVRLRVLRGGWLSILYIAFACFSAMSPITGSFHIWPWFAFNRRMIQRIRPPRPISGQIKMVSQPSIGMWAIMLSAIHRTIHATREKEVLEGVEPDEPVLVVGFHHQENDRWDDGDVGQHSGHVVRHASGGCARLWDSGERWRPCRRTLHRSWCRPRSGRRTYCKRPLGCPPRVVWKRWRAALQPARDRCQATLRQVIKKTQGKQSTISRRRRA